MNNLQSKQHHFTISEAVKYGSIEKAVLLNNFRFWLDRNMANDMNLHDGYYWTYNSSKALNELFPYMSERSIRRYLDELEEEGILKSANYNKSKFDRTKWYTIVDEYKFDETQPDKKGESTGQNSEISSAKTANDISQNGQPIPNNKPYIKQNNNNINNNILYESKKETKNDPIDESFWNDLITQDKVVYLEKKFFETFGREPEDKTNKYADNYKRLMIDIIRNHNEDCAVKAMKELAKSENPKDMYDRENYPDQFYTLYRLHKKTDEISRVMRKTGREEQVIKQRTEEIKENIEIMKKNKAEIPTSKEEMTPEKFKKFYGTMPYHEQMNRLNKYGLLDKKFEYIGKGAILKSMPV